ncbi:MAG: ABC transporter ATP-binding protein [Bacteroidetes bacterium]|nr:ABC transporter ATP-binding protein [Bacteroidota bacterium]MBU2584220.1 ABC transporter ATP-binding protein [Bacteroidota bacterium]
MFQFQFNIFILRLKDLRHSSDNLVEININTPILRVESLCVKKIDRFASNSKVIIDDLSFSIERGEFFTIVGENGSGKSTLAHSLTGLLKPTVFDITGTILLEENNLLKIPKAELEQIRKKEISYIFQNPYASFDPIRRIGSQMMTDQLYASTKIVEEHFSKLKLNSGSNILKKFPFQLSGGMLQRVSAVRAILSNPKLIIADEPTSALDKPISNLFMDYLMSFKNNSGATILFITQDFKLAAKYSDKIAVLKSGKIHSIHQRNEFLKSSSDPYITKLYNSYNFIYESVE